MDYNNLLSSTTTIPTVIGCQEKCLQTDGCDHFTYFTTGATQPPSTVCALLRSCERSALCSSFQNCTKALSGARTPPIIDACCSGLPGKFCKGDFLSQHFQIASPLQCQALCQAHPECRYFTQISGDICFLYNSCKVTESCSSCTSGPADPSREECNSDVGSQTLLLGGWTKDNPSPDYESPTEFSSSLELVTEDNACEANMPEMPEGRRAFAATLMGKTILYCGGCTTSTNCGDQGDCYSFQVDKTGAAWEQSAFMNIPRYHFSIVAAQGKAYAIGGEGTLGFTYTGDTVEEYTPGEGWSLREDMRLPVRVAYHCSVSVGPRIIVIGGANAGKSYSKGVYEFDLDAPEKSWTELDETVYGRQQHSCTVGSYRGQQGIFVTGGSNSGSTKVEFLIDSVRKWRVLPSMSKERQSHTASFMDGTIFNFGGYGSSSRFGSKGNSASGVTTYERLNKTNQWTKANLCSQRKYHAGISLPAGTLTCLNGDNLG